MAPVALEPARKRRRWLLALVVAGVYALHQDVWNWRKLEPLVFGFLPAGLAYHAGYSLLAAATLWLLVRLAWPQHLEQTEDQPASKPDPRP
jgi:hypothetical protein